MNTNEDCVPSIRQDIQTVVQVEDLWKSFAAAPILKGITFKVRVGEILGIIGPSGGGKTTLLRCLNLLEIPDRGSIEYPGIMSFSADLMPAVPGRGLSRESEAHNRIALRRCVGMVFQSLNLWEERTVLQNLILAPCAVLRQSKEVASQKAKVLCAQFGLERRANARVWELSGGEKQRVAILRALLMNPKMLLLDEITSALDPVLTVNVMSMIRDLRKGGLSMIIVTHHVHFASAICDRLMFLDAGEAVQIDHPENLLMHPANHRVASFLKLIEAAR